jgi:hypothetical protein
MVGRECLLVRVFECGYVSSACGIRDGLCLSSTFEMIMILSIRTSRVQFRCRMLYPSPIPVVVPAHVWRDSSTCLSIDYLSTPYILPDGRKTPLNSDRASVQRITSIGTTIARVHNQTIALIPTIPPLQVTIPETALGASPREFVFYFAPWAPHQVSVGMRSRLLCSDGWCDVLDGFLGQVETGRLAYVIVIQPGHDDLAFFGPLVFFGVVQVLDDFAFAGALELVEQACGRVLLAWLEFRGVTWPLRLVTFTNVAGFRYCWPGLDCTGDVG